MVFNMQEKAQATTCHRLHNLLQFHLLFTMNNYPHVILFIFLRKRARVSPICCINTRGTVIY
jgi:hypothetical protein